MLLGQRESLSVEGNDAVVGAREGQTVQVDGDAVVGVAAGV
jgi:hypothetical protein